MQAKTSIINRQWCQTGSNRQLQIGKKKSNITSTTGKVKFRCQSVTCKHKALFLLICLPIQL